ncbi:uncharacterized protein LOC119733359 isoform X1 [Patiria miniata]|uniref:Uncharacterized protein n=1 Tax=Patiria miniata TaxID=46514 RepID=A0A914AFY0_PATMI|nr:uncharacterized protein LOC119733359 isoform X1 [Patiria miniata]
MVKFTTAESPLRRCRLQDGDPFPSLSVFCLQYVCHSPPESWSIRHLSPSPISISSSQIVPRLVPPRGRRLSMTAGQCANQLIHSDVIVLDAVSSEQMRQRPLCSGTRASVPVNWVDSEKRCKQSDKQAENSRDKEYEQSMAKQSKGIKQCLERYMSSMASVPVNSLAGDYEQSVVIPVGHLKNLNRGTRAKVCELRRRRIHKLTRKRVCNQRAMKWLSSLLKKKPCARGNTGKDVCDGSGKGSRKKQFRRHAPVMMWSIRAL